MIAFKDKEYGCHMELTLDLIGGKWKSLLLWHIGQKGVMRFGELSRLHPRLTQKMLTQQLRELEADGLLERTVYPQVPPKVEYRLTRHSRSLIPLLDGMIGWGKGYLSEMAAEGHALPQKTGAQAWTATGD